MYSYGDLATVTTASHGKDFHARQAWRKRVSKINSVTKAWGSFCTKEKSDSQTEDAAAVAAVINRLLTSKIPVAMKAFEVIPRHIRTKE